MEEEEKREGKKRGRKVGREGMDVKGIEEWEINEGGDVEGRHGGREKRRRRLRKGRIMRKWEGGTGRRHGRRRRERREGKARKGEEVRKEEEEVGHTEVA